MPPASAVAETYASSSSYEPSTITRLAATICLVWYIVVAFVCSIGYTQIWRHYSSLKPKSNLKPADSPHVTIIRPVKGLEPQLYECLAATFRQDYPIERLHIRFCVSDRHDPSIPVIERLLQDFSTYDAQLLLEDEDEALQDGRVVLGPNPKIRNMSRAYREATGDIIWVIDCNVWVGRGACGRMVDKLEGHGEKHRNKLVHHLPLVVDILGSTAEQETHGLLDGNSTDAQIRTTSSATATTQGHHERTAFSVGGGRLEEAFMSSSHPKFYVAINTVLVAPCIVGKSTMFRRSHLDSVTDNAGIDYFSENICEDHLIGDKLWKTKVPEERQGEKIGKHALCFGDLAIQPMANMSLNEYWSRRVRWLRVRKFTVTMATLVEPGTESFLCSLYGAFAVTTLPYFHDAFGMPQTWTAFVLFWLLSVATWCFMDRKLYKRLHSAASVAVDDETPFFAKLPGDGCRRPFKEWLPAWIGREALALPVWFWAFYGGTRVSWRGKQFWVGLDMKVHEISLGKEDLPSNGPLTSTGKARSD